MNYLLIKIKNHKEVIIETNHIDFESLIKDLNNINTLSYEKLHYLKIKIQLLLCELRENSDLIKKTNFSKYNDDNHDSFDEKVNKGKNK